MGFPFLLLIWKPSPKCWPGFCYSAVCNRFTHTRLNSIVLCHATSGPGLLPQHLQVLFFLTFLELLHLWWPRVLPCFEGPLPPLYKSLEAETGSPLGQAQHPQCLGHKVTERDSAALNELMGRRVSGPTLPLDTEAGWPGATRDPT